MNKFLDREPAVATAAAGAAVSWLLSFLVLHGVLTADQASTDTQVIAPIVAALIVMAIGFVIRRLVTPAGKWIAAHAGVELAAVEKVLTPQDLATISKLLEDKLGTTAVGLLDRIDEKLNTAAPVIGSAVARQLTKPAAKASPVKKATAKPMAAKKPAASISRK